MSDISFVCPNCKQSLEAQDNMTGETIDCPSCNVSFVIPSADAPHAAGDMPADETICEECGNPMPVDAVLCVKCGFDKRIGKRIPQPLTNETGATRFQSTSRLHRNVNTPTFPSRRGWVTLCACLAAVLWLCWSYVSAKINQAAENKTQEKFKAVFEDILPDMAMDGAEPAGGIIDLGKTLVIGRHEARIYFPSEKKGSLLLEAFEGPASVIPSIFLPGYARPKSLDGVQYVVEIGNNTRLVRGYENGAEDHQHTYDVFVWRWPSKQFMYFQRFAGTEPPNKSGQQGYANARHFGTDPWSEVVEWIRKISNSEPPGKISGMQQPVKTSKPERPAKKPRPSWPTEPPEME